MLVKSIVRGGSILEENTDKLMELTKRCGEQDASHFQNPLLLDIGKHLQAFPLTRLNGLYRLLQSIL